MNAIEWFGTNFIGMFEAGAEQFTGYMTGIVPLLAVLLTFTNSVISLIGEDRVTNFVQRISRYAILRYSLMPVLAVLVLTNPMMFTFGKFVEEKYKPALYDATVSFCHPVTGLFPYANAAELFIYLGIANGVAAAGFSQSSLAVRYFLVGILVSLMRGIVTEQITKFLIRRGGITEDVAEEVAGA